MKKLLSIVAFSLIVSSVLAQNQAYKSTFSFNTGFSLVSSLLHVANSLSAETETYALPAFQINYDRGIENWFSFGIATSYQAMGINYTNYEYQQSGNTVIEDFNTKISRLNVGVRPLFHYGNADKIDMYSGFRVGATKRSINTDTNNPDFDPESDVPFREGTRFSAQLILYGLRGYFTDNLGANFEFAIGTPHFFSFGLNYRL